ncbi:hypothetical protein SAMN04487931_102312 [Desulfobacula phenolica]|uniref:MetA-pathway of phenol degradation n=2 Tax=Desulfobacula phenolica TaxID=90732 RepID=A0A1H2DXW6_9BACT|nr:hypothetical protein SAMN04487931_102312 [Desulfobacula phenolica]
MKIILKTMSWILIMVVLSTGSVFAGAWTAKKGAIYNKLTFNIYDAEKAFNDSGDKNEFPANGDFSDTNIAYYVEYGITDKITVLGSVSYKWLKSEDDTIINKTTGFSDLDMGLKYCLVSGDFGVVSAQALVKIPELYDDDEAVALGNSQYDTEFRLLYGKSLYPFLPGYVNIEAGYRLRAEEPADEFRYLLELGIDMTKKIYGRVKLDGILGINNDDPILDYNANPTATLNYDLGKLDLALGFKLSGPWSLEFGYRTDIYGKNTAAGDNVSFSFIAAY